MFSQTIEYWTTTNTHTKTYTDIKTKTNAQHHIFMNITD